MRQTRAPQSAFSSLVTLAAWRLRRGWFLLLVTGLGMVVGLMLVCALPLYADVTTTAGLRDDLNASHDRSDITIHSTASLVSTSAITSATQSLNREIRQQNLGLYLKTQQFSFQTQSFTIASIDGSDKRIDDRFSFLGAPPDTLAPHIQLLQGRLPQTTNAAIETLVTPETARDLNLKVGSLVTATVIFQSETQLALSFLLPVHIVGIVAPLATDDAYWHGETLDISPLGKNINVYRGIAPNDALIQILSYMSSSSGSNRALEEPVDLVWYYRLDSTRVSITNLNDIIHAIANVQVDNYNNAALHQNLFVENTLTYIPNDNDILTKYQSRTAIASVPVRAMLVLVLGLVLFFVSIMTDLLIEQQAEAIAIFRSRGATRWQIIQSFLLQGLSLGIIGLIVGPLLALPAVVLLIHLVLAPSDQGALNILHTDPLILVFELWWLPLIVVMGSLVSMATSLIRATSSDVLALRREAARTRRRSIVQRLGFDGIAILLALLGYGFSTYILNTGVLDAHLRLLLLSPLTLFEIVFLVLALLLILLRVALFLLQQGASLAARSRGATLQLALTHMARAPREPVRMMILLALAIAFAIFTLVFTASQAQRQSDIANYQAGADFVGAIPVPGSIVSEAQLRQTTTAYGHIQGVSSATVGYTNVVTGVNATIALNAVDADTFAQTALWNEQNSTQALSSLVHQLVERRGQTIRNMAQHVIGATDVPAIVDATTWQTLNLVPGKHFILVLSTTGIPVNLVAIAEVNYLPLYGGSTVGGVLVDYQTYTAALTSSFPRLDTTDFAANTVWLRTSSDAGELQYVRNTLKKGPLQLTNIVDRRGVIEQLNRDPLYLDQLGIMTLGALTALALAFVGNLVGSWFRVRVRQTNFAVLRALGATMQQISSILTWEQGIIYTTALLLGTALGALFSAWIVPLFVYTSVSTQGLGGDISNEEFYIRQSIPPISVIVPSSLWVVLGMLLALCLLSLFSMMRASTTSFVAQKLRLNED